MWRRLHAERFPPGPPRAPAGSRECPRSMRIASVCTATAHSHCRRGTGAPEFLSTLHFRRHSVTSDLVKAEAREIVLGGRCEEIQRAQSAGFRIGDDACN